MSRARDHAAGGASLPRGVIEISTNGGATYTPAAATADAAELAHPMPVGHDGHDGHDGIPPPEFEQQSLPEMLVRARAESAVLELASPAGADGAVWAAAAFPVRMA